jgi:quercetin dioxygenase-like cupin family protein
MPKRVTGLVAVLLAAGLFVWGVLPSAAQVPPPPIGVEFLTGRAVFPDEVRMRIKLLDDNFDRIGVVRTTDPSLTVVARYTIQPGAQFPWHSHAGPVIVNVVEGSLVYVDAENCGEREYTTNTAFVDLGHGHVHSAYNPSETDETVLVATFFEAPPAPAPLLIPADAPEGCVLP